MLQGSAFTGGGSLRGRVVPMPISPDMAAEAVCGRIPPLPLPNSRSVLVASNLDGLSPHFRLLALDWLGTGLSGRPPFRAEGRQAAEDFFVESLDKWRAKMGLDKFILMGHSLGGYLSACYALKHPEVRDTRAAAALLFSHPSAREASTSSHPLKLLPPS